LHHPQQFGSTLPCPTVIPLTVRPGGIAEVILHAQHRVEGVEGTLEDHRHLCPAEATHRGIAHGEEVHDLAIVLTELGRPVRNVRRPHEQPQEGKAERALTAAALADQANRLAGENVQIHVAYRPRRTRLGAILDRQIAHGKHRRRVRGERVVR